MICVALLVNHTSLMTELFQFKLHFYMGDLCDLTYSAGIALAVRRIYYQETCEGRSRSLTVRDAVKHKDAVSPVSEYLAWSSSQTSESCGSNVAPTATSTSANSPDCEFLARILQEAP